MELAVVEQMRADLRAWLADEENGKVVEWLALAEAKSGRPREQLVWTALGLLAMYLVIADGAGLVCNLIGFAYPCYASIKAIRTERKDDDTQWLTYWTVFALLRFIDEDTFPLYWLAKFTFLCWLWLPLTRGAESLYTKAVAPLMDRWGWLMCQDDPGDWDGDWDDDWEDYTDPPVAADVLAIASAELVKRRAAVGTPAPAGVLKRNPSERRQHINFEPKHVEVEIGTDVPPDKVLKKPKKRS